jgi:hypothetical protein
MRRAFFLVLAACIIAGGVGAWALYSARDRELSERPNRSALRTPNVPTASSLQVSANVQYAALSDLLTRSVPESAGGDGRTTVCGDLNEEVKQTVQKAVGGDVGKLLGEVTKFVTQVITVNQLRHVCQDVDYNYNVKREGVATVSGSPAGLRIELPVSAEGRAGFTGDLAKALALDHKNFRGSLVAIADATVNLDTNWCPILSASVRFEWRDRAQLEIVHNVWLNIDGSVGPQISKAMDDALAKLRTTLTCNMVRQKVGEIWHPYTAQFNVPGGGATAILNFVPEKAAFSGVTYGPSAASLAIGLVGSVDLATVPSTTKGALPIPSLEKIPATSNRISLALPLRVRWEDLSNAATNLVSGQVFGADSLAGHSSITIDKIEVYPSGQQIVLALHISASLPGKWLNSRGWIYLTAAPNVDPSTQTLRATNLHLTRELDNAAISALTAILHGPIESFLQQHAVFDMKPAIENGRDEMTKALAHLAETQKVVIAVTDNFAGVRTIQVGDAFLTVTVGVDGVAHVSIDGIAAASPH